MYTTNDDRKTIVIDSFENFIHEVLSTIDALTEQQKQRGAPVAFYFRGQANRAWGLTPRLAREDNGLGYLEDFERRLIEQACQRLPHLFKNTLHHSIYLRNYNTMEFRLDYWTSHSIHLSLFILLVCLSTQRPTMKQTEKFFFSSQSWCVKGLSLLCKRLPTPIALTHTQTSNCPTFTIP